MNDKKEVTDPPRVTLDPLHLAGAIELTPEARAILTKHVNRRIVWGYKITKTVLQVLALAPLLISLFFIFIAFKEGTFTLRTVVAATVFIFTPAAFALVLFRLASRF